ncbi:uncharacterized protein LOC127798491 [Diospyros lotus]|uniref:uncharacterized protein LOC127798491 n=1 Tax=Diospyros lotus TaxID=55363 RepID=UPI00225711D7|nr:uncharacterized protein LOC127798491 [Diospyros lotus]
MALPQPSLNHVPPPPGQPASLTNLDRLMEALTPHVPVHYSSMESQDTASDKGNQVLEKLPYYCLKDVWKEITEWSFYGVGVPLMLKGTDSVVQYYFPTLSGIQLYVDPSKLPSRLRNNAESSSESTSIGSKMSRLSLNPSSSNEAGNSSSCGVLVFEYLERESPFVRKPLIDKIFSLTSDHFPELMTLNSCDVLPTSWICVAWYPICRIPLGSTLRELDTAFLTFHNLSTQSRGNDQPWFHGPSDGNRHVDEASMKISVPVFGLASYKLWGSIMAPTDPHECQQASNLWEAASQWLSHLQMIMPRTTMQGWPLGACAMKVKDLEGGEQKGEEDTKLLD